MSVVEISLTEGGATAYFHQPTRLVFTGNPYDPPANGKRGIDKLRKTTVCKTRYFTVRVIDLYSSMLPRAKHNRRCSSRRSIFVFKQPDKIVNKITVLKSLGFSFLSFFEYNFRLTFRRRTV